MMQQAQEQYALKRPRRLAYWDGEGYQTTSRAVRSGAWSDSQLYVNYPGDIELWVNGKGDTNWTVRVGHDAWDLPPFGWVMAGPDFLEVSAQIDGQRRDYVVSPEYVYYDGRGGQTPFRGLACQGPIAMRTLPAGETESAEILNLGGAPAVGWSGRAGHTLVACEAYSIGGDTLSAPRIEQSNGLWWFHGPPGAFRYVVSMMAPGAG